MKKAGNCSVFAVVRVRIPNSECSAEFEPATSNHRRLTVIALADRRELGPGINLIAEKTRGWYLQGPREARYRAGFGVCMEVELIVR